jgi:hypothetical protein
MAFNNRIRLPFKLHKPQFQEEVEKYRKANGVTVVLSTVVRKIYEGITDEFPEKIHERLKMALRHDTVHVEGDRYVGLIAQEGDYNIEWSDFLSRPIAQAKFKAEVTPYNASNSNCGTCEIYTQVVTEDDNVGTVAEGATFNTDVLANDSICCNPVTITLITINSTYVNDITVEPDNTITIELKTPLPPANGVILATYRAECDNGLYDEANIIADITGSSPAVCLAPTNLAVGSISTNSAQATWDAPTPAPDSYDWELYLASDLGTPIQTGNITDLYADFNSLLPNTEYRVYVNSNCGIDESNSIFVNFTTLPESVSEACGQYQLENTDFNNFAIATYLDCTGDYVNINIPPLHNRIICALQTSPGNPVDITVASSTDIIYVGLC